MKPRVLLPVTIFGYLLTFYIVWSGTSVQLDEALLQSLNGWASNGWVAVLSSLGTQFGTEVVLGLIGLVLYLVSSREKTNLLIGVLFAIALSDLVLSILKAAYFRPRPYQSLAGVILPVGPDEGSSFPSGHATRAFAVFVLVILKKGKRYGVLLLLSIEVALSRVILGLHFPSDVLGGALLGTALAGISIPFLSRYVFPRIPRSSAVHPKERVGAPDMG